VEAHGQSGEAGEIVSVYPVQKEFKVGQEVAKINRRQISKNLHYFFKAVFIRLHCKNQLKTFNSFSKILF